MHLTVLISCMNQSDHSIIERSNVQTDVVVVNQCDIDKIEEFDFINQKGKSCHAVFVSTTDRGLSKSRNACISYAKNADICLLCDDDEVLDNNYEENIIQAYDKHPGSIVITFSLIRKDSNVYYPTTPYKIKFMHCLRTNSLQITFNRHLIIKHKILFDEKLGSGTGNGGGEENAFMLDSYKLGKPMYYEPTIIGTVMPGISQWFDGYNARWLRNFGWTSRRLLGTVLGISYIVYFCFTHKSYYGEYLSFGGALKNAILGFFDKK